MLASNTWAVSLMRYGAGVVSWTKIELQNVDRKTRKLMTIYGMLPPRGDVDRLYYTRENGSRGLMEVGRLCTVREKLVYRIMSRIAVNAFWKQ